MITRLILLVVVIITACRPSKPVEPTEPNGPKCDLLLSSDGAELFTTMNDTTYHSPCFNPNDANEIVYIRSLHKEFRSELRKRNLLTGEDIFLANVISSSVARWNKNGWIVFDFESMIYRMKENGDSLTLLTSERSNFEPDISPDGQKVVFQGIRNTSFVHLYIMDIDGSDSQVIPNSEGAKSPAWSPDGKKIALIQSGNLKLIDLSSSKITALNPDKKIYVGSFNWLNDNELIINGSDGYHSLHRMNILTQKSTTIGKPCVSNYRPAPSSDRTKILVERKSIIRTGDAYGIEDANIFIMNIDGSGEKKVEF